MLEASGCENTLSLSLSLSHTHTHTHTSSSSNLCPCRRAAQSTTKSPAAMLSLQNTHTHTHTHTHQCSHSPTQTHLHVNSSHAALSHTQPNEFPQGRTDYVQRMGMVWLQRHIIDWEQWGIYNRECTLYNPFFEGELAEASMNESGGIRPRWGLTPCLYESTVLV